jgi:outer membrane biosynthesis protein TonB
VLQAVNKWTFAPAKRGGQAVACWLHAPVSFRLE